MTEEEAVAQVFEGCTLKEPSVPELPKHERRKSITRETQHTSRRCNGVLSCL